MRFRMDVCVLLLATLTCSAMAVDPNTDLSQGQVTFPYTAEITGTDIYMRSGPGMNHYRCGKLSVPEQVTVVAEQNGWSKILPPEGAFSWISKENVKFDPEHAETGVITADDARVWAGSEYVEPMHSTSLQVKLPKGAKVKLLGEEKGDYYKIAPPEGAYLWVNTQYTRFIGAGVAAKQEPLATIDVNTPADANSPLVEVNEPNMPKPAVRKQTVEEIKLKEYRELAKQVDAERAKHMDQQNWTTIRESLTAIADTNDAGRAQKYAKAQLDRVEGFELAQTAGKALKEQNEQLAASRQQIERKKQEELAKVPTVGKYVVIGIIKPSLLYSADSQNKRYVITDDSGKIIAYATAAQSAAGQDISSFFNKKVGLVGEITRDPQSGSSLVTFTAVEEIK